MVLESVPVLGEKVGNTLEKSSVFFVFVLFFAERQTNVHSHSY